MGPEFRMEGKEAVNQMSLPLFFLFLPFFFFCFSFFVLKWVTMVEVSQMWVNGALVRSDFRCVFSLAVGPTFC